MKGKGVRGRDDELNGENEGNEKNEWGKQRPNGGGERRK